jgi:hypothetical protein
VAEFLELGGVEVGVAGEVEAAAAEGDLEADAGDAVVRVEESERTPKQVDVAADRHRPEVKQVPKMLDRQPRQCTVLSEEGAEDCGGRDQLDGVAVEDLLKDARIVVRVAMREDYFVDQVGRDAEVVQILSF